MGMSRLFVSLMLAALCVSIGCGGDDGGSKTPDAKLFEDAKVYMDAPPADAPNASAEGLGKVCDQMNPCPTGLQCIRLSMTATHGFCTLSCGTTQASSTQPPANGNMVCMQATPAPGNGTPLCALNDGMTTGTKTWYCAVACGSYMNQNLGQCPGGLTCSGNICQ